MKKVVFKVLLLIIAFTNVAMAMVACYSNEVMCHLESSDDIEIGYKTYQICVYEVSGSDYTISVTYKGFCPLVACYNPETGKVRF